MGKQNGRGVLNSAQATVLFGRWVCELIYIIVTPFQSIHIMTGPAFDTMRENIPATAKGNATEQ